MSALVIRLPAASGGAAHWLRLSDDGAALESGAAAPPFSPLPEASEAARTILIVPGEDVTAHSVHLPAAGEAQTRAAARFAVEDELAVDAAGVHLAIAAAGDAAAPRLVAAASTAAMESWLADAAALGVTPQAASPEWARVPAGPGECGVLIQDGVAHANFGAWGFSAECDLAGLLMPGALERFDVGKVVVWGDPADIAPQAGWGGRPVEAHPAPDPDAALALLAQGARAAPVDLLQGDYAPRRAFAVDLHLWRRAGILAFALFASWLVLTVAEAGALNRRAAALRAEANAAFAEAFPDEARIVNPRLQMQTRLAELRGREGGAFLDLAAVLAAAVSAQDGVEISAMRYDRNSGALNAELLMADYETLQALRGTVQTAGAALEEGASRQADGRVVAAVTVTLP